MTNKERRKALARTGFAVVGPPIGIPISEIPDPEPKEPANRRKDEEGT